MFWNVALFLLVLWGIAAVTSYPVGGMIPFLVIFALGALLVYLVLVRRGGSEALARKAKDSQ